MVGTPEYSSWRGMIERCENPNHRQFKDYGGRGVTVCPEWRQSFTAFVRDMGPRPAGCSVERRKNHLGYTQENCYWSSRKEQARNKRNNRLLTAKGQTKTLAEWSEETGLHYVTIVTRIDRHKWPVEKALTTPKGSVHAGSKLITHNGRTMTITDWAKELKTSRSALAYRFKTMSVEEALTKPILRRRKR